MATLFPFPSSKAWVRAMRSTNWAEVLGGKGLVSMVSKLKTTVYPALLFPSKTTLFPSVYQISSGLVRGSSDNPSRVFVRLFKVSGQEWKWRAPSGVGRRVAGLRTSQGDIVWPGFSYTTISYLRIIWSDIHKWRLPFRSCFTWWLVKIVSLPQKFSSVTQSCLTLCDPMNHSTPGFPVHYQLPEFTQTHVHRVGDAIQPPHPLSSPSPPAFNLSQHQGLFQWVFRTDFL